MPNPFTKYTDNTPFISDGAPYTVLGFYMPPPKGHYASKMAEAILSILEPYNLVPKLRGSGPDSPNAWGPQMTSIWADWDLHAEVRRFAQHGQGSGWHKDGDLEANPNEVMDHAAVLWAEVTPTEFKDSNGKVWQPKPGEIVIARNLGALHRSPPDAPQKPKRRWFFRQRVEVPSHLELP